MTLQETLKIALVGPATPSLLLKPLVAGSPIPKGMGGTPVNALAIELRNLGHDVTVITGSTDVEGAWIARQENLTVRVVPYRERARDRALDFFRNEREGLVTQISECAPDLVHAHWTYEFALAALASPYPHLITIHDAPLTVLRLMFDPYRILRAFMAYCARVKGQNFSAVSPDVLRAWRWQMGHPRFNAPVIPNITQRYTTKPRDPHEGAQEIILDVANASKLKNVRTLISGFAMIADKHPRTRLRLVGPGLEPSSDLLSSLPPHLLSRVDLRGILAPYEVAHELANATIFCHPSLEESQGMAILEAMHAGVPVIVAKQAKGAHWTIGEGRAGLIVDAKRPEALARSMDALLSRPCRRAELTRSAMQVLEERFSPIRTTEMYLRSYRDILAKEASTVGMRR